MASARTLGTIAAATALALCACGDDTSGGAGAEAGTTDAVAVAETGDVGDTVDSTAAPADVSGAGCEPQHLTFVERDDGFLDPAEPPIGDAAVIAWIAHAFCAPEWFITYPGGTEQPVVPTLVIPSEEATCIGSRLVEELGAARTAALWRGGPWSTLGFGLANNLAGPSDELVQRAEAETVASVFAECSTAWKEFLILSVTGGSNEISRASAECTGAALPDDVARHILAGELDRAYDDPAQPDAQPFAELVAPLQSAMEGCLTPAELGGLDWS